MIRDICEFVTGAFFFCLQMVFIGGIFIICVSPVLVGIWHLENYSCKKKTEGSAVVARYSMFTDCQIKIGDVWIDYDQYAVRVLK